MASCVVFLRPEGIRNDCNKFGKAETLPAQERPDGYSGVCPLVRARSWYPPEKHPATITPLNWCANSAAGGPIASSLDVRDRIFAKPALSPLSAQKIFR
jgi:hypothetical protein